MTNPLNKLFSLLQELLTSQIKECEVKLERAQKLTDGLKDEKERWSSDIERLSQIGKKHYKDLSADRYTFPSS